jgi:hypothetical protein
MLNSQQKYAGTRYTIIVAMLVVACVFSPALLLLSRSFGYVAASVALVCSAFCVAVAFIHWRKYSELTIPSITSPRPRLK